MVFLAAAAYYLCLIVFAADATKIFSPFPLRSSSFVAPFTRPALLLSDFSVHTTVSDETTAQKQSMDVRELMQILEQTYPSPIDADHDGNTNKKQLWARTRKYLYQYRANLSRNTSSGIELPTKKRKRTTRNRGPLTRTHIQQIISFLETTFPNQPELQAHILQSTPRILSKYHSIESRLLPTVEFLKELYGDMAGSDGKKGTMFYEAIKRNSNLLLVRGVGYVGGENTRSGNESDDTNSSSSEEVEAYLENVVGISSQGIAKLKNNQPTLFQLSLKNKVQPAVEYLLTLLGHSSSMKSIPTKQTKQLVKIVTNHPNLLQLGVDSNLKPTALFLRDYCELTDNELATIVGSNPSVLGLAVDGNLRPKMQLLTNVLANGTKQGSNAESDGTKTALRKSILKHPQVLALSSSNICTKVDYFDTIDVRSNSGNNDNTLAARLLMTAPSVYSLSLADNIRPKVDYLAVLWGWSSLSDKLVECPLLTLSMDNIQQTLSFYNMTGYIDLPTNENREGISPQNAGNVRSRYIATSLYNRLLPRWNFLLKEQERKEQLLGVLALNDDTSRIETSKYNLPSSNTPSDKVLLPPLHLLAGASDEVFCRQLNLSLSEYTTFKEEAVPRLKFNSQFDRWLKTGKPIDVITL
jgi:hypothetical protein